MKDILAETFDAFYHGVTVRILLFNRYKTVKLYDPLENMLAREGRASKACLACRRRKVRCNVSSSGIPCANCEGAGLTCAVTDARKARYKASAKEFRTIPSGFHVFDARPSSPDRLTPQEPQAVSEPDDHAPQDLDAKIDNFLATVPEALDTQLTKQYMVTIGENNTLNSRHFFQEHPIPDRIHGLGLAHQYGSAQSSNSDPRPWMPQAEKRRIMLPPYLCPLREELNQDDLDFLHHKGALSVPNSALQGQLLEKYVLHVHPFLPLLDLEDFYQAIYDDGESFQIPVILFQAVMFCAVPYVDMELLRVEGLDGREEAREKYFEKVRLLFDFNIELDPMTLIRALVLMTCWYDNPEDIKGRWHWIRIALSYAYEIGLDRSSEVTRSVPKQQKAKKRLWWCCYMRDRMISLNERRPTNIRDHEADIPILTSEDFETHYFCGLLQRYNTRFPTVQATVLNEMFIQLIRLCITFGRVLDRLYAPQGHRRWAYVEPKIVLLSKTDASVAGEAMTLDQELCQWNQRCSSNIRRLVHDDSSAQDCGIVTVHRALLDLLYQSMRSMVHRPLASQVCPKGSAATGFQVFSRQRLREAAQESTMTAERLHVQGLLDYLPPIGITTLLFAGMQHVNDMCSRDEHLHEVATHNFRLILTYLYRLKGVYRSARHAIGLLRIVHQRKTVEPFPSEEDAAASGNRQPQSESSGTNPRIGIVAEELELDKEEVGRTNSDEGQVSRPSHMKTNASKPALLGGIDTLPWEFEANLDDLWEWYGFPESPPETFFDFDQLLEGTSLSTT
ncbi:uncharacterized protein PV06_07776 [Exophiala oligosperma]|uniref:Zn(2)-C6 fungal-type domain-containing protein n=1 Tax=Exophiala oligosperma TaxID=215243 RepID=A0A0D2DBY3_9EURO|nr:uncharacterized protein PV06_07776 [Exophiala oligosperma]KIW40593.1 hypothetical protein PV06_07776 [Exophiala oligosperma]